MKRILFVCTGNTCRSPMAEYLLRAALKERGIRNIRVSSAGLCAEPGQPMSVHAKKALALAGIRGGKFRSRLLTREMLEESNLILVMTESHKRALLPAKNVFTVGEFAGGGDIPDPYGGSLEEYMKTRDALRAACDRILNTIV